MESTTDRANGRARPFLKWAGGKRQLASELVLRIDALSAFERYHEPFVGAGALFFELHATARLGRKQAFLSDTNSRLIETYQALQSDPESVIVELELHAARHSAEHYYAVRAAIPTSVAARAARIIYLNRTCFNGLYRENSRGEFNVPIGRYVNPTICDPANLHAVSHALQRTKIECRPFESVLERAKPRDLVYFDPPYDPVSKTASFTAYDRSGFGEAEQRKLAAVFTELDRMGVNVLLSNSMTPLVKNLYKQFQIDTIYANRAVNSRADRRGKVPEALVRNF